MPNEMNVTEVVSEVIKQQLLPEIADLKLAVAKLDLRAERLEGQASLEGHRHRLVDGQLKGIAKAVEVLGKRQDRMEQRQDRMEDRQDRTEERLGRMEASLGRMEERQDRVEERLGRMEERQDRMERRMDEGFAWLMEDAKRKDKILSRIAEVVVHISERVDNHEQRLQALEGQSPRPTPPRRIR